MFATYVTALARIVKVRVNRAVVKRATPTHIFTELELIWDIVIRNAQLVSLKVPQLLYQPKW